MQLMNERPDQAALAIDKSASVLLHSQLGLVPMVGLERIPTSTSHSKSTAYDIASLPETGNETERVGSGINERWRSGVWFRKDR